MTTTLSERQDEISSRLAELAEEYGVPGAALAVASGDEMITAATGVLSRRTGYPVTTDSWFQIGSVTKLFTSSLAMQLADEGLLDLASPVRTYLPDFSVGDDEADETITVRNLLTHSSGIQGDYFADFGRGDDAVRRYVESLPEVGLLHRPGAFFSYCNSGFSVLGRLIEVVRGKEFGAVLAERLFTPLGIAGGTTAEQAMLGRAAVGHVAGKDGAPSEPASRWALPHAAGPAGATPFMDPAGLVSFARMHLSGGRAADGTVVLSPESVADMQTPRYGALGMPDRKVGSSWILADWGGEPVIGHTGGTLGQYTFFLVHPASRTITVLMTNGPGAIRLNRELVDPLLSEITGLPQPEDPAPPADPPSLDRDAVVGEYRHYGVRAKVSKSGDGLVLATVPDGAGALSDFMEADTKELVPFRHVDGVDLYVTADDTEGMHIPIGVQVDRGPVRHLHIGGRAYARVVDSDDGDRAASVPATM